MAISLDYSTSNSTIILQTYTQVVLLATTLFIRFVLLSEMVTISHSNLH